MWGAQGLTPNSPMLLSVGSTLQKISHSIVSASLLAQGAVTKVRVLAVVVVQVKFCLSLRPATLFQKQVALGQPKMNRLTQGSQFPATADQILDCTFHTLIDLAEPYKKEQSVSQQSTRKNGTVLALTAAEAAKRPNRE